LQLPWIDCTLTADKQATGAKMPKRDEKLKKLQEQRDKLNKQILTLANRENAEKRKRENRKKVLVGAMMLDMVKKGEWQESELQRRMDAFLTRDAERALFDLQPLPKKAEAEKAP
jgi:large subunit ribosomal protein L7/L12